MRVYEVDGSGIILTIYGTKEEFQQKEPGSALWPGSDYSKFSGGFLDDVQLTNLLVNGLGGSRNREYLKLKMAHRNIERELGILASDHGLEVKAWGERVKKLEGTLTQVEIENGALESRIDSESRLKAEYQKRVEDALSIIGGVK